MFTSFVCTIILFAHYSFVYSSILSSKVEAAAKKHGTALRKLRREVQSRGEAREAALKAKHAKEVSARVADAEAEAAEAARGGKEAAVKVATSKHRRAVEKLRQEQELHLSAELDTAAHAHGAMLAEQKRLAEKSKEAAVAIATAALEQKLEEQQLLADAATRSAAELERRLERVRGELAIAAAAGGGGGSASSPELGARFSAAEGAAGQDAARLRDEHLETLATMQRAHSVAIEEVNVVQMQARDALAAQHAAIRDEQVRSSFHFFSILSSFLCSRFLLFAHHFFCRSWRHATSSLT